ncbi:MAG: hypothetical protein IPK16_21905 [Anaerolineales bacterium]|nr:hypothetical protein [Anaerolineales bacterium]
MDFERRPECVSGAWIAELVSGAGLDRCCGAPIAMMIQYAMRNGKPPMGLRKFILELGIGPKAKLTMQNVQHCVFGLQELDFSRKA